MYNLFANTNIKKRCIDTVQTSIVNRLYGCNKFYYVFDVAVHVISSSYVVFKLFKPAMESFNDFLICSLFSVSFNISKTS